MNLTIINSDYVLDSDKFDIVIVDKISASSKSYFINFQFENQPRQCIVIKLLLSDDIEEVTDFNFHHFKNTKLLFFRFLHQWGIIDLESRKLKRHTLDKSLDSPFFYLHQNCILIVDDLFAETINLDGNTIDRIGNEQPHEISEFDDYFEFDIIGVEKRKLMKKGSS